MEEGTTEAATEKRRPPFTTRHIVAFVLCCVLGRQYNGWQGGLSDGFGAYMVKEVLVGLAFICYYLILAEIWSAIPFSGGGYGLARASLGFYPGFLVGCTDALCYIFHTAVAAQSLGIAMCSLFNVDEDTYGLVFTFAFYVLAVALAVEKSLSTLRWVYPLLALIIVSVLLVYLFGIMKWTNFDKNASLQASSGYSPDNWFNREQNFMVGLRYSTYPFVGIRSVTLLCRVTENPKRQLIWGLLIAVAGVIVLNLLADFVTAALPGGILATSQLAWPMQYAFQLMFRLSEVTGYRVTWGLCLCGYLGRLVGFILPSGIILQSLGSTNLLPSVLGLNHNAHYEWGVFLAGITGFAFCVIGYFYPLLNLSNIVIMWTVLSNMTALVSYYRLRTTYVNIQPTFHSRVGLWGAAYALVAFAVIFISAAFFQGNYFPLIFLVVYTAVLSVYYFAFAVKTQTVSEEEELFLSMHVRNNNKLRRKRTKKPSPYRNAFATRKIAVTTSPEEAWSGDSGGEFSGDARVFEAHNGADLEAGLVYQVASLPPQEEESETSHPCETPMSVHNVERDLSQYNEV